MPNTSSKSLFEVEYEVDMQSGRILATYYRVRKGKIAETREIVPGSVFADYSCRGRLLGIEILGQLIVNYKSRKASD